MTPYAFASRLQAGARPLLSLALVAALAACSSVPGHKDAVLFVSAPLSDAEIMPVIEEGRGNIKVVVVDAVDNGDMLSQQIKVGKQFTRSLEGLLSSRAIEVVDDALAPRLDDALRTAEAMNSGSSPAYAGPKVAKFAVRPVVTASTYSAAYQAGTQVANPTGSTKMSLLGAALSQSAGYAHQARVSVQIRVYEMPTLRMLGSARAEGSASLLDPRQGANAVTGGALLKQAIDDAVATGSPEVLNLMASKGHVIQRRFSAERKMSAFQVSMGTMDGLKAGDKVDIFSVRPADTSMLKAAAPTEEIFITSGVVSGMLLTDVTAWVVLNDEVDATKVRRGDLVKQKHERTFMDKIAEKVPGMKP